jgi:beta-glucanase (GH16 family)
VRRIAAWLMAAVLALASAVLLAPAAHAANAPLGPDGSWTLVFSDNFDGTSLNRSRWHPHDGWHVSNVTARPGNVSVANGELKLTLSSTTAGAAISSAPYDGAGINGYTLGVGHCAEARVLFPGDDASQPIYNWPAWWTSGPNWPAAGEHDIAEGLGGALTVNYHSRSGAHNHGAPAGDWNDAFHIYTLCRKASSADVYWDGALVRSYATDDNGQRQALLLNIGKSTSRTPVLGNAGAVRVDYVRAWAPA